MSFNDALVEALLSGIYKCPECGSRMEFENDDRDTLICLNCGYDEGLDHYGYTDEEYNDIYSEVYHCENDEDDEDDEYNGESYDEVYGELSDD